SGESSDTDTTHHSPLTTHLTGRIATILIPRFDTQLYHDPDDLTAVLADALAVAGRLGAETVSLTGLLPSATDYGRALPAGDGRPAVTTGHASTTATVVFAVRRILAETGRDLTRERVAFVGLGSVGSAVLRLMLRCLPHPAEIRLCDVYGKHDALAALRREARDLGYAGPVHLIEARGAVPAEVYEATLIVGAANAPDVLDVDHLRPGTLIVDDSAPHCFHPDKALRRLRDRGDILFTEGGTLAAPEPIRQTVYLPPALEAVARSVPRDLLPIVTDPTQITGCVVSSLLSTLDTHLPPTVGLVDGPTALAHYVQLTELGFDAAPLHCESVAIDPAAVAAFRARFGGPVTLSVVGETDHPPLTTHPVDWSAETALDPAITAAGLPPVRDGEPQTVLLTGATGFLGAFLLDELLRQTQATVICLTRAGSDAEAGDRVRANLRQYGIDAGDAAARIVPLAGDLARPRLGVSPDQWTRLTADVDAVYHNGATVHFLHPYATLKAANVRGTEEVLWLATTDRLKPVAFVSSLSVLSGVARGQPVGEDDRDATPDGLENGYAQSKWAAEELVWRAADRGVPVTVLRPGRIVWHSRSGALGADDLLSRAIRACVQLGAAPAFDTPLEMTPVDYVARAAVAVGRQRQAWGQAYHLINRQFVRLRDLLDWVRAAGYTLESLPPEEWLRRVQESASNGTQDALSAVLPFLASAGSFLDGDARQSGPALDDRHTRERLAGTGVECPPITAESVAAFLARLAAAGRLAPAGGAAPMNGRPHANGQAGPAR
ncbi:MAG TPA: thioester reductase domain-containing protein, partial [Gemmataceae bacterium]